MGSRPTTSEVVWQRLVEAELLTDRHQRRADDPAHIGHRSGRTDQIGLATCISRVASVFTARLVEYRVAWSVQESAQPYNALHGVSIRELVADRLDRYASTPGTSSFIACRICSRSSGMSSCWWAVIA